MTHLVNIRGHYYYNRRVPELVREYDPREVIRISLKTDSKEQARRKAVILNEQIEAYWQNLIDGGQLHDNSRFKKAVRIARQMGFSYQPMSVVAALPLQELLERVLALKDATPKQVEAVLGGRPEPEIFVKDALEKFWALSKDKVMNKSDHQIRKWQNPRKKAVENFISIVGNKNLKQITREDIVAFRDWWIDRIKNEDMNEDSANKNFIQLKTILETVSEHEKLGVNIEHLFRKILLKVRFKQTRLPFTSKQIVTILNSSKLGNMHPEAKWLLFAMSETGVRPAELVGLLPEDIKLDAAVPHICIVDRKDRPLKTAHSQRKIPLVGYALDAFRHLSDGFSHYRNRSDNLTTATNKFLRENDLMPSNKHSVYSLRHSFQDRILNVNTPDRVQAELMGHKFHRPKYGDGATLEHKLEWLEKVRLKT